jgi:hypothetical protein
MLNKLKKNSRGQISETMTWIVATVIIILILTAFIYASGIFGEAKQVTIDKLSSFSQKNPIQSIDLLQTGEKISGYEKESANWTYSTDKSLFAYFLSQDEESRSIIYQNLNSKGQLADDKISELKLKTAP